MSYHPIKRALAVSCPYIFSTVFVCVRIFSLVKKAEFIPRNDINIIADGRIGRTVVQSHRKIKAGDWVRRVFVHGKPFLPFVIIVVDLHCRHIRLGPEISIFSGRESAQRHIAHIQYYIKRIIPEVHSAGIRVDGLFAYHIRPCLKEVIRRRRITECNGTAAYGHHIARFPFFKAHFQVFLNWTVAAISAYFSIGITPHRTYCLIWLQAARSNLPIDYFPFISLSGKCRSYINLQIWRYLAEIVIIQIQDTMLDIGTVSFKSADFYPEKIALPFIRSKRAW